MGQDPTFGLKWTLDLGLGFESKLNLDLGLSLMLVYGLDKKSLQCLVCDLESSSLVLAREKQYGYVLTTLVDIEFFFI